MIKLFNALCVVILPQKQIMAQARCAGCEVYDRKDAFIVGNLETRSGKRDKKK